MAHEFHELRKEYTAFGSFRIMDARSYRKDMKRIGAFCELALDDFPNLRAEDMKVIQYSGPRHQGMIGLEFPGDGAQGAEKGYAIVDLFDTVP